MKARPFHHQRPLAACAAFYGAGVVLGVYCPWQPRLVLAGLVLCVLGAAVLRRMEKRAVLGWMGAFLFLGLFLSGRIIHRPLPAFERCPITGVVAEEVVLRPDGTAQGYLEQTVMEGEGGRRFLGTVYWTYYPDEENPLFPTDGQKVRFTGKVYQPSRQDNPYGFDFRMFLLEKGIHVGVSGAQDMVIEGQGSRGVASFLYRCRAFLSGRLEAVFQETSALPRALLLGEKARLPQEVQDSFSKAGVAHILSVSGLHVSMLTYCVMRLIPRRLGHKVRFFLLGLFLFLYCGMLGFPAPAVRAALFMLLNAWRRRVWRGKDWLTVVSAAFLLILLVQPMALFSGSFQLSFGAVLGIFLLLPKLENRFRHLKKSRLGSNLLVTLAASVGLMLPTIQLFHSVSLIGLLLNPFVCLLFMTLLPLYGLLLLLGCIWLPAAQTLAVPFHIITSAVEDFLLWAGELPFVQVQMPHLPGYVVAAVLAAFLLMSGFVVLGKKKRVAAACALVAASLGIWQLTACRQVQYIQFSVGQADAAVVIDGRETVVIDAGEYGGDVASYLRSTARQADTLVITHLHKDHCLGVEQLLEHDVKIGRVLLPHRALDSLLDAECLAILEALRARSIPVYAMSAGQYFETGRCRFTALWPWENAVVPGQNANRYSLMLLCELDGVRLLSCADAEGDYELYGAADADILKVAHHGSRDGTQDAFLRQVTPDAALISADSFSDYLPHPDVLSRLEKNGVSVYNTGERGAITITCKEGAAEIVPYLPEQQETP